MQYDAQIVLTVRRKWRQYQDQIKITPLFKGLCAKLNDQFLTYGYFIDMELVNLLSFIMNSQRFNLKKDISKSLSLKFITDRKYDYWQFDLT